ncbi:hypothetical protein HRG84_08335 [Flavisolibacter sp. BT320]|nr:hypothetical protein [Flavisolibacter longurius]
MRYFLVSLFFTGLFFSCQQNPQTEVAQVKGKTLPTLPLAPEKVKGTYSGDFKGSPISLVLNYVSHQHASGFNVHKGLMRNLSGRIAFSEGKLQLELSEPGSNQYDGIFSLLLDTATWQGSGTWKPFKKGEEASFTFQRMAQKEDEYGQQFFDSSVNYISLKPDGSCTYTYLTDSTQTGQTLTIRGNYKKEGAGITIFWQKNAVFPSGKSTFTLVLEKPFPDSDYTQPVLNGEGRTFTETPF